MLDRVWYQRYEQGGVVLSSTLDPESEAKLEAALDARQDPEQPAS